MRRGNLNHSIPASLPEELVTVLAQAPGVRIERIVSRGQTSPPGSWYDQPEREYVLVVSGLARLEIEGQGEIELAPGAWVVLEAHERHRVTFTQPDAETIWLAVFYGA